ncbi:hypothetical protein [Aeromicrobium sp. HA]|uniref:hypothetical protein n=1 Tax=Aeromicrobium sp. HA TaxID=3009077 RepID=UPI0022AF81AC|nr:hypothetical protein [Aeromicrobium sp. HA]
MSADATMSRLSKYRDFGMTAKVVTARKLHYCDINDNYPGICERTIEPGAQYIRSVMFPNHDASGYDTPVAYAVCATCAEGYTGLDDLADAIRDGGSR